MASLLIINPFILSSSTLVNWAATGNGGTITANVESLGAGTKSRVIDGIRNAGGSFGSTGGFQQNGAGNYVEITFVGSKTISRYDIVFAQDGDINSSSDPANTSVAATTYAVQDFTVQYWNGSSYTTIDTVTGNNFQWVQRSITPTATTKMKFIWDTVRAGAAYLLETECWGI
jgi:hypothetical protein